MNVIIGDALTGQVRTVLDEKDDAWIDVNADEIQWLEAGKRFLWLSERDGWRHAYSAARAGGTPQLITKGSFDVISIESVDEKAGWLYYIASPDNATQRYLYRTELNGNGKPERLSPAGQPGSHSYSIAPNAGWAFHTYSTISSPPSVELVHLPDHRTVRQLAANATVIARVKIWTLKHPSFSKLILVGASRSMAG